MKIVIFGAGGIGSIVGGHLKHVGYDVVLIGRPGHVKAIRERGLRLVTPNSTHIVRLKAVTSPSDVDFDSEDAVFLCVKGQNTEYALEDLKAVVKEIPIFCFQNGVRNEETAARFFPRVYGVLVRISAVYLSDGEAIARRDPPGWLVIGCYPQGIDERARNIAKTLRDGGFPVMLTPDIMPYKWGKLISNLHNAVGAITNAKEKMSRLFRTRPNRN
jgi:2-dehydropantoate 2-reductase